MTLNFRYILKLFVVFLILGGLIYGLHYRQSYKQADGFFRQAEVAKEEKDTSREMRFLRRYLALKPNDIEARDRLARLMMGNAKNRREVLDAYLTVDDVLRRDPSRDGLRRALIDFAVEPRTGLFSEAKNHIDDLLAKTPNDGELEGLYARCLTAGQDFSKAAKWFTKSLEHRPDIVDNFGFLAYIQLVHLKDAEEGDKVIEALVKENPKSFKAYLIAAEYWQQAANTQRRAQAIAEAKKLAPDERDVIISQGMLLTDEGRDLLEKKTEEATKSAKARLAEARTELQRGTKLFPNDFLFYRLLANVENADGQYAKAIAVLREGLEKLPKNPDLLVALVDNQLLANDTKGAGESIATLENIGHATTLVKYQKARLKAVEGDWVTAIRMFEALRIAAQDDSNLTRQINFLLARGYEQLGDSIQRLQAFQRAIPADPRDPLWLQTHVGLAEAQASLGQAEDALRTYRKIADRFPGANIQVARMLMVQNLQRPVDQRDFKPAQQALDIALRAVPDSIDGLLLKADLATFQGDLASARKIYDALKVKHPKEPSVRTALVIQDLRDGKRPEALANLEAAQKELNDPIELRLTRARFFIDPKDPNREKSLRELADNTTAYKPEDLRKLTRGLADIADTMGLPKFSNELWDRLGSMNPNDVSILVRQFERALSGDNEEILQKITDQIRRIEGDSGPTARLCQAQVLVWKAEKSKEKDSPLLSQALRILLDLERDNPLVAKIYLTEGMIYDTQKNNDAALEKYVRAIELGEMNPTVLQRAVQLYFAKGQYTQADELLRKLPSLANSGPEIQRLATELSLRTQHPDRALASAVKAVNPNSKDPKEHLWLGQVYWTAGEKVKAEASIRKSIELRPDSPDGWMVLINYLISENRRDDAIKELDLGSKSIKKDLDLFLAQANVMVGRPKEALAAFQKARQANPKDHRVLQAEADFLMQIGALAQAKEAWQRLLALTDLAPAERTFAQQMYAVSLSGDRDYRTSREALVKIGLADVNGLKKMTGNETPEQLRSYALVLALQKDRASKLRAIELFEQTRSTLSPGDLFVLAQLYNAVNKPSEVSRVLDELLRRAGKNALYLAFQSAWLLREKNYKEASIAIERLADLQPDAFRTADLRARLAAGEKNPMKAQLILEKELKKSPAQRRLIAGIAEDIGLQAMSKDLLTQEVADARKAFEMAKDEEAKKVALAQAELTYAVYLGRHQETAKALEIALQGQKLFPPAMVGVAYMEIFYAAEKTDRRQVEQVIAWLDGQQKSVKNPVVLLNQIAALYNLIGDYDKAITVYQRLLELNAEDPLALNNIAYLLSAHRGQHPDALKKIDRAKQIMGPETELLDTEALIYLEMKDFEKARSLLEEVVASSPSGANYFHLARAEHMGKRLLEARLAWDNAQKSGLKIAELHPLERQAYQQMQQELK
jgi:tetratricopeptide (TPR) repeat protein